MNIYIFIYIYIYIYTCIYIYLYLSIFHSTDGLIALHYAKNACGTTAAEGFPLLDQVFEKMYEYVQDLSDVDMIKGKLQKCVCLYVCMYIIYRLTL
jgi:hypothetical protein